MYKYKSRKNVSGSCCPMGTLHDGIVECYWFGTVKLSECRTCTIRKDKEKIKKNEEIE